MLDGGRPRLDGEGAIVGGYRTMVEAVAMRTFGLGGDSEVHTDERGLDHAADARPAPAGAARASLRRWRRTSVLDALDRQVRADHPGRLDGRFACRTGLPERFATGLEPQERALYGRLTAEPQPLDGLLASAAQRATLDRLVARGLAHLIGFTPSDAMHVLGRQDQWVRAAAYMGADVARPAQGRFGPALRGDARSLRRSGRRRG